MLSETKKTAKSEEQKTAAAGTNGRRQEKAAGGKASGPVVYIGPTIRGVVQTSTVFNNGLPAVVKEKVKKMPLLGEMLIPVADLGKARKEMAVKGSAVRSCYDKVAELLKKEGGNVC